MSTNLNSDTVVISDEVVARFVYEQRAATVLFNIIKGSPSSGCFLLPANVCPIVPLVLLKANRCFEFVDISPETLCMDHDAIIKRWMKPGKKPAGIIYVRSYGAVFETSAIFSEIKSISPGSVIIDDRCLCPPEFNEALLPNTDVILYSTGYAKFVDLGFGGFAVISDELPYCRSVLPFSVTDLEVVIEDYKNCLATRKYYNYKDGNWLDTTAPSMNWARYRSLVEKECERASQIKNSINAVYTSGIPPEVQLAGKFQSWRFNILVRNNSNILDEITKEGLFASRHYDSLAGVFGSGDAPIAEKMQQHVINLFNDRYFDVEKASALTKLLAQLKLTHPESFFK